MDLLQCYNKGCLQKFNPSENTGTPCTFHPGVPVFHDVYKSWSCCKKKTTDFTEFLNIKGCEKGLHNPEKPQELEQSKTDNGNKNEVVVVEAPRPPKPPSSAPRLEENHPLKKLAVVIAQSLKNHMLQQSQPTNDSENDTKNSPTDVAVGTQCKRGGCTKTYENNLSNEEVCWYHSGVPIFHEGMKFWSCCQRKTSDFDSFLQQAGCTSGHHCWTKEEAGQKAVAACRYDWHQTANDLYVTIYSKLPTPDDCIIKANEVNLSVHIEYDKGNCVFDLEIPLWGAIDLSKCLVTMSAAKVEIKMKKVESVSWPKLQYHNQNVSPTPAVDNSKMEDLKIDS
jgi:cysteine/histidine-rich domain-containing protein 1